MILLWGVLTLVLWLGGYLGYRAVIEAPYREEPAAVASVLAFFASAVTFILFLGEVYKYAAG